GRSVVAEGGAEHRAVGLARDQVPERDRRGERRAPDADETQALNARQRPRAAQLEHLAVLRTASSGKPARAEPHEAREPVDRAEIDEPALDRRLAVEHRAER